MNPYATLAAGVRSNEAASLHVRLAAWHDAMVTHERRLRTGRTADACDDECPHGEARALWSEALETFGPRAQELTFLRSRATQPARGSKLHAAGQTLSETAEMADPLKRTGADSCQHTRAAAEL